MEISEGTITVRTEASKSDVFDKEWSDYLNRESNGLQVVITQDRIYLEKAG